MKQFNYLIKADYAIHIGPASRLAGLAKAYPDTTATLQMGTRTAEITHPLQVMTMGIRKGDIVTVTTEGESEVELLDVLYQYFEDML